MRGADPDDLRTSLEADFECQQLLQALSLSRRFHLFLAVSDNPRVVAALIELARERLRASGDRAARIRVFDPYALGGEWASTLDVERFLGALLSPAEAGTFLPAPAPGDEDARSVWWVDLSRAPRSDGAAIELAFLRLNEQRNVLTRRFDGPLVLGIPPHFERTFARAAPDFWSIRSRSFRVETPALRGAAQIGLETFDPFRAGSPDRAPPPPAARPTVTPEGFAVAESRRARALLDVGAVEDARNAAAIAVGARQELLRLDPRSPRRVRDLAVALALLGDAARDLGDLPAAHEAYGESLALRRGRMTSDPDDESARRDVAVALTKLGGVSLSMGDVDEAARLFREGLTHRRALVAASPADPERLRDLTVSLQRVGDVARERGDVDEAARAYAESLEIRRAFAAAAPDHVERAYDLAIILARVGDLARERGAPHEAEGPYAESLAIRRRLHGLDPAHPDRLWSLVVGLRKVAEVAQENGDDRRARAAIEEALPLARALAGGGPGRPAFQHELALVLLVAGRELEGDGRALDAAARYQEARDHLAPLLRRSHVATEWAETDRSLQEALAGVAPSG